MSMAGIGAGYGSGGGDELKRSMAGIGAGTWGCMGGPGAWQGHMVHTAVVRPAEQDWRFIEWEWGRAASELGMQTEKQLQQDTPEDPRGSSVSVRGSRAP
jgi:hypothetical protein